MTVLSRTQVQSAIVGLLVPLLSTGRTAAQLAEDLAHPNVGSGEVETDQRHRLREFVGANPSSISAFIDPLVDIPTDVGTLTATSTNGQRVYTVDTGE